MYKICTNEKYVNLQIVRTGIRNTGTQENACTSGSSINYIYIYIYIIYNYICVLKYVWQSCTYNMWKTILTLSRLTGWKDAL